MRSHGLFWRDVARCPKSSTERAVVTDLHSQAKVGQDSPVVIGEHDIGGFNVTMNDALAMSIIQSRRNLAYDIENLLWLHEFLLLAALFEDIQEGMTLDQLHGEVIQIIILAELVHADDIGMIKIRRRACLTDEALRHLVCFFVFYLDHFDSSFA